MRKDFIQANMVYIQAQKIEKMLENILPKSVVAELKMHSAHSSDKGTNSINLKMNSTLQPRSYDNVTIGFTTTG